ncbi:MAG: agmatinase [Hyphomicrobiales bacterium]|nr:agmatinase [Hyphomicrobiales bacterium]
MQAIDPDFLPVSGFVLPRFAGIPTFMRLPYVPLDDPRIDRVDIGLVGVPWDGGTTNRAGARHGPRALRDATTMVRQLNQASGIMPFHLARCADLGDVAINPASVEDTLKRVTTFYRELTKRAITPMTIGGDHLTSLPVLRAVAERGPVGMIHFDSHTDFYDSYFGGFKFTHGTPFRRAVEEGLLDPKRVVQIGIRGSAYDGEDVEFARSNGVRLVFIEELQERGVKAVMDEACSIVGSQPTYLSFDIDGVDPAQAPGTGTPEIGGFSTFQAQQMLRLLGGLEIVAADFVELSPPFDVGGITAWAGANIVFEILCVLAQAARRRTK